jgi:hypothetical protein
MSLATDFPELQKITGDYLNWGRSGWDAATTERLDEIIKSAYRRYLAGRPLDGDDKGHDWTWLTPIRSITTTAGVGDYDLPDDFGAVLGPLTWSSTSGNSRIEIPIVGEGMIRAARQGNTQTGRPVRAAERLKSHDPQVGTRHELLFDPIPDGEYVFQYASSIIPDKLDAVNKYPLGGPQFGELLIAACLAVAESRYRRGETDKRAEYDRALQAAIHVDLRNVPDHLGSFAKPSSRGQGLPGRGHASRRMTTGSYYYNGNLIT